MTVERPDASVAAAAAIRSQAADSPPDTAWLVLRAQSGDRQALEALLGRALEMIRPYASVMIGDADRGDDVVQDVLLLVYRKLESLREPRAFAGWVRRIAARQVFRTLRVTRREQQRLDELEAHLAGQVAEPLALDGVLDEMPSLMATISPASRAVLALHYRSGLTLDEICTVLELPMGTVKSRLAYGLGQLRRSLRARGG
jgi:RNA polymerase sigma-70 factor (ECF subfamily)